MGDLYRRYNAKLRQIQNLKDSALILENDNCAALNGGLTSAFRLRKQADQLWKEICDDCAAREIAPPERP